MENKLNFGFPITYSIERIKLNPWFYVTAGLTLIVIPQTISAIVSAIVGFIIAFIIAACGGDQYTAASVGQFIGTVVGVVISLLILHPFLGAFFLAMKSEKSEGKASPGDLFKVGNFIIKSNVTGWLMMLIVSAGYAFCIIPGILITPLYYIAITFVSQGENSITSITRSFNFLKNNFLIVLYCLIYLLLYVFSGLLLCCVGTLITVPMFLAALYYAVTETLSNGSESKLSDET
jgi:hypothetical protein